MRNGAGGGRVLVTGGTGVFGAFVIRELLAKGTQPVVLALPGPEDLIVDVREQVVMLYGDVTDAQAVADAIDVHGVDCVVHLAALMPPVCQASPADGVAVNIGGTVSVLDAARDAGVTRVVYTSAKGVYGPTTGVHGHPEYRPMTEDLRCLPVNVYDATKYAAEVIAGNYAQSGDLEVVSLRFGMSYGPGKLQRHGPLSIHSTLIENAMLGQPTNVPRGGDQRDDMVYAGDVANGIMCALQAPSPLGGVYNIATGVGVTLRDFADAVRAAVPGARIEIGPGLGYLGEDVADYYSVLDIQRARRDLGYEPRYDLQAGVLGYIETLERLGLAPVASEIGER